SLVVMLGLVGVGKVAHANQTITYAPASLTFPATHVSASSASQNETATIGGTPGTATITGFTKTGSNCADFSINPNPPPNITLDTAGTTQQVFAVTFTPSGTGARGPCTFTSQDNGATQNSFTVSGTGGAPTMTTSPGSIPFGNVHIGNAPTQDITIDNTA